MCPAIAVSGGGLGFATAPAILAGSAEELRAGLDWLPGRIVVIHGAALAPSVLADVVRSAHIATIRAVIVLSDQSTGLDELSAIGGCVPVVRVPRESDQRAIRRATLVGVDVHREPQRSPVARHRCVVDLRGRRHADPGRRSRAAAGPPAGRPGA